MTLIIIALITLVTFMAVNVSTLESRTAMQDYAGSRAMYASRAGLNYAMSKVTQLRDSNWVQNGGKADIQLDANTTSFSVELVPHPDNAGAKASQLAWQVTSTGFYGQAPRQAQRTIVAFIQQEPFSKYAYFTDRDISSLGGVIRFVDNDAITGPVRTNGYFTFAGNPKFSAEVRSANLEDTAYTKGPPASYKNPNGTTTKDPSQFYRTENNESYKDHFPIALNNSPSFSFLGGQAEIPLPKDNNAIGKNANTKLEIPAPANPGSNHYKNPANQGDPPDEYNMTYDENTGKVTGFTNSAGKAVNASDAPPVFKLSFRADSTTGAEVYRWDSASSTFKPWNVASGKFDTKPTVIDTTEQTLSVDGFTVMEGTVKGRTTVGSRYDVHLTNDLVYKDKSQDVLGIVSNRDIIVESNKDTKKDRTIHASMMALNGSFYVDQYNAGSPRGTLHLLGGIIQYRRGPVGTGTATKISTGYAKDYQYDDKLITRPPLNFPNTGEVYVVSITDKGAAGSL